MNDAEESVLAVAEIVLDAVAMGDAALASDFDEARFRAQIIAAKADAAGHIDLALAAARLVITLGPGGTPPHEGYGAGILRVSTELEKLGFQPL